MSKRPEIVSEHEKAVEREIQDERARRDTEMAEAKQLIEVTENPEPFLRSFSRGPKEGEVSEEARRWIREEEEIQQGHYRRIYQEMERLAPYRDRWVTEFFERISGPRGYSVHAGTRKTIARDELPERPDRPWRVVW